MKQFDRQTESSYEYIVQLPQIVGYRTCRRFETASHSESLNDTFSFHWKAEVA